MNIGEIQTARSVILLRYFNYSKSNTQKENYCSFGLVLRCSMVNMSLEGVPFTPSTQ